MKTFKQIFLESFCEREFGSAKRMVGFGTMIVALSCVVYLTIVEGCSACVEHLLQTLIISACALLGVSSVTSIFKQKKQKENE